jgi:putative two-component system response regulator
VRIHRTLLVGALAGGAVVLRERRAQRALERFAAAALETLLDAIEANDHETGMHVRRVAAYALILGDAAGIDRRVQRAIERVALFHDIGKIHEALFDIVHEPKRLSAAERRAVLTHPARGADVLAPLAAFYPELPAGVLAHHERWDGRGYPRGLKGARIPFEARIVSVADTFDAVAHHRRYRRGRGVAAAVRAIAEGRGAQFDPAVVDLMMQPSVLRAMSREPKVGRAPRGSRRARADQPAPAPSPVPDVDFRWRSKTTAPPALT